MLRPNRALVLHTSYRLLGQSFDPTTDPVPAVYTEGMWGFHLTPAPGGRTRLVTRTRSRGPRLMRLLIGEPVHFVMQTRQLHRLRELTGGRLRHRRLAQSSIAE
jgi:hypothetical protein